MVMTENIKPGGFAVNWFVFPIREGAKKPPLVEDNLASGASNDPRQIGAWRKLHPRANWGVALRRSNLLVVDVDCKVGKIGRYTFNELDFAHPAGFPATYTVRTPSGGLHLYYRGPHVFAIGKHGFGPDVDSPNYTLLPGSRLKGFARPYQAVNDLPVAVAPSWFYEVLGEHKAKQAADHIPVVTLDQRDNIERAIRYLVSGAPLCRQGDGGNITLFNVAALLKDFGVSEWQAVQLLGQHYNDTKCDPPWMIGSGAPEDDLAVTVHNAFAYGVNAPGSDTAEAHFAGDVVTPEDMAGLIALDRKRDAQHRRRKAERPVRMPVVDGYVKTGRYVVVDGVRVPLVEDLP